MISKLSSKIGACEDFHAYVCSEEEGAFKLPADRSSWTFSFKDNSERILCAQKKYFDLLGKGYAPTNERAKKIKRFTMRA